MKNEVIDTIMKSLITISAVAILTGALFKLQHWPYGDSLITIGFLANISLSSYEIRRLRKIISKSENEKNRIV